MKRHRVVQIYVISLRLSVNSKTSLCLFVQQHKQVPVCKGKLCLKLTDFFKLNFLYLCLLKIHTKLY